MGEWETEDEYAAAAAASLPTPSDTPYRTPSRTSRRSSRQKSISPAPSSSPPPLPPGRRGSRDVSNDENISILDPGRFTPTLHANLVAEILNLRRDQEEKIKIIEGLETEIHDARVKREQIEEVASDFTKENRVLKRQLAALEGGSSNALLDITQERDVALENSLELRQRLESAQKKLRAQEHDSTRSQKLWLQDKDNWESERRKLERIAHVAESRLKTVLAEVAAIEAQRPLYDAEKDICLQGETAKVHESDTASLRTMSITSSIRFSTAMTSQSGFGSIKPNAVSLADELDFEDEDEQYSDHERRDSIASADYSRSPIRDSAFVKGHRRTNSTESLNRPGSLVHGRYPYHTTGLVDGIKEVDETFATIHSSYVDTGVQPSPPPSPRLFPISPPSVTEDLFIKHEDYAAESLEKQSHEPPAREWEIEANQRRKRVHATPLPLGAAKTNAMVSSASQTAEGPLSPPRTPVSPTRPPPPPPITEVLKHSISIATQTDEVRIVKRASPPTPISIPSIQLHPPRSAPATPREPVLPQHYKDFGCQVGMSTKTDVRSISVQTEEIRVDKRIHQLPIHLQPSTISSQPPSPEPYSDNKRFSPIPGNLPPRNPRRVSDRRIQEQGPSSSPPIIPSAQAIEDAYPGNNDDGPVTVNLDSIRRPHRISSLFAGFGSVSSDEAEDFDGADQSDNEWKTALSAPRHLHGKSRPIPRSVIFREGRSKKDVVDIREDNGSRLSEENEDDLDFGTARVQQLPTRSNFPTNARQLDKPLVFTSSSKQDPIRRTALIHSGVAAHQGRARSPSLPEPSKQPPFPIPTRASSRNPITNASAPSDGRRSPTWGRGYGKLHYRSASIRKSRSATALTRGGSRTYRRHGSRSPPPMSVSTEAPESPSLPPMPNNEITTPRYMKATSSSRYRSHRPQPSNSNTAVTSNTTNTAASNGSSTQATSVVDAIAQTMVGEWMYKYVRRRKSFGVNESTQAEAEAASGLRHKRWVWLAPYERAVMWSSKQPTSGSALMGKTGRKLEIQSVLDVKDDNPPPKGVGPLFNRSILILTPARALKFTATSSERHYVWLTALSFLAHSSQAVPEVVPAPLPTSRPAVPGFEIPRGGRLRKNPIRDSIRIAKGKTAVARNGPVSVHSSQGGESSHQDAETFYHEQREDIGNVAAAPPVIPRISERGPPMFVHGRKRSNTGGSRIPPPISYRGFSGPTGSSSHAGSSSYRHAPTDSTAGMSVGTNGSSDIYQSQPPSSSINGNYNFMISRQSSARTSDVSSRPGQHNFFDAVGTMRMEAFISPMAGPRFDDFPNEQDEMSFIGMHRRRSREQRRRSRNRDSFYSGKSSRPSDDYYGSHKNVGDEEHNQFDHFIGAHDPFRGF